MINAMERIATVVGNNAESDKSHNQNFNDENIHILTINSQTKEKNRGLTY